MTHVGHYIERCECGIAMTQCRCMGPKEERIVSPCRHKPQTVTLATSPLTSDYEVAAAKANGFAKGFAVRPREGPPIRVERRRRA